MSFRRIPSLLLALLFLPQLPAAEKRDDNLRAHLSGLFKEPFSIRRHNDGTVSLRMPNAPQGIPFKDNAFKPGSKRYLVLEMQTEAKGTGGIMFNNGRRWFELIGDREFHIYNIDLYKDGKPQVGSATFMRFADDPGAQITLRRFELSDTPQGPPMVDLRSAGLTEAINHPGSEREFFLHLHNRGGGDATELSISSLRLPRGVTITGPENWRKIPTVKTQSYLTHVIRVRAERPVSGYFQIDLSGEGAPVTTLRGKIEFTRSLNLPKADYVPEPQPVRTDYEIGALYFPGWTPPQRWPQIREAAPERRPLLGYYDEGNPEVVDWQIKYLVENGFSFLLVDWYWHKGNRSHEEWIKAFDKARYNKYLKWAVMWANHTPQGSHSVEDQIAVTNYWIENYFNKPYYYRIDGRPVVVYWQSDNMDRDLGPGGAQKLLELSQKLAREAGLPGIFFIAMKWPENGSDPKTIQKLRTQGFEMTSIYHYMAPGSDPPVPYRYDFRDVAAANKDLWNRLHKTGILPFLPNLSTGWNDYPWHFNSGTGIVGRTPELFRQICRDAKEFSDRTGIRRMVLAPLNEWGEGSYAEPNREYGFQMYEAVRDTFARPPRNGRWPLNYAPEEVGLGPYPLEKNQESK